MNRQFFRASLGALPFCLSAVCVAAAPQYAVVDLGSATVAGAGLAWQTHIPYSQLAPAGWPAAGGSSCYGNPPKNFLGAQFGNVAVGATCLQDGGEEAAKWTLSGGTVTLTALGALPGANNGGGIDFPFAYAWDFNTLGDIVGQSTSRYPVPVQPSRSYARHGFIYNNGSWTELIPIAGVNYESTAEGINDSREVVGQTETISSTTGEVLDRAFVYINGTMYNLTFYLVGGPTVLLSDAYGIDCQGNIAATGTPASGGGTQHNYLLLRQGAARTNCPK
jgi:probable HAF family extracellular repeat protein